MKELVNLISLVVVAYGALFLTGCSYLSASEFFKRENVRMTVREAFFSKRFLGRGFHFKSIFWLGCSVLFINLSGLEGWTVYVGIVLNVVVATLIFYLSIFLGIMLRVFLITLHYMFKESLESLSHVLGFFGDVLKKLKKL